MCVCVCVCMSGRFVCMCVCGQYSQELHQYSSEKDLKYWVYIYEAEPA